MRGPLAPAYGPARVPAAPVLAAAGAVSASAAPVWRRLDACGSAKQRRAGRARSRAVTAGSGQRAARCTRSATIAFCCQEKQVVAVVQRIAPNARAALAPFVVCKEAQGLCRTGRGGGRARGAGAPCPRA